MGVVEKLYTVDVLTLYCTYLPKLINVALICQNYCKNLLASFLWTQCTGGVVKTKK